jgi:Skp family chaperone for outer membrane proteins
MMMRRVLVQVLSLALAGSAMMASAQTTAGTGKAQKARKAPAAPSVATQLKTMSEAIEAQQKQIEELRQELQSRDQAVQQLQQRLDQSQSAASQAQAKADSASAEASKQEQSVTALRSDVDDLKQNASTTAVTLQETQKNIKDAIESPLAIHYKGVTLTPGGFLAAETVWRQRAEGADINTAFNNIPFPGSTNANVSEFNGSARQSRISLLGEGKLKDAKLSGYYEADFLSAAATSNNNQSNSYSLRQRQVWGQAAINGWSFTGGQMWSLVTETKKGVDNRSEALPMTIDPQYTLGFSWARQYGFRVAKNFGNKFWLAASIEDPEINSIGGGGFNNNFVVGQAGLSGGLLNPGANYAFNSSPDIIAKAVLEPGWGHYEVYGVFANFRDRIYPCATTATTGTCGGVTGPSAVFANNSSNQGGGLGVNIRESILNKHVDIGVHFLGGNGIERYGTGGLPDVTVRPNGSLVPLRGYQGLGTLEYHSKKWDFYFNAGSEYAQRTVYTDPATGALMGYGRPKSVTSPCVEPPPTVNSGFTPTSSCKGDTRYLEEGTIGFWYRVYAGPKGRIQLGPQYSFVQKATWSGTGGAEPKATNNMFFTSFRYYLP